MIGDTNTVNILADGVVGRSGYPTRVFQLTVVSDATAGESLLRNGATVSGAIWVNPTNVISKSATVNFGEEGILFPAGCYADIDVNCLGTLITYRNEEV